MMKRILGWLAITGATLWTLLGFAVTWKLLDGFGYKRPFFEHLIVVLGSPFWIFPFTGSSVGFIGYLLLRSAREKGSRSEDPASAKNVLGR